MSAPHGAFEVLTSSRDDLDRLAAAGIDLEAFRPGLLDASRIPPGLHRLIPAAAMWGISDDVVREEVWSHVADADKKCVFDELNRLQREIFDWLGGPAAKTSSGTPEYIAFTCLTLLS